MNQRSTNIFGLITVIGLITFTIGIGYYAYADHRTCPSDYRTVNSPDDATFTSIGNDIFGGFYTICSSRPLQIEPVETNFILYDMLDNNYLEENNSNGICITYNHVKPEGTAFSYYEYYCYIELNDDSEIRKVFLDGISYTDISNINMTYIKLERSFYEKHPIVVSENTQPFTFMTLPTIEIRIYDQDNDGKLDTVETKRGLR